MASESHNHEQEIEGRGVEESLNHENPANLARTNGIVLMQQMQVEPDIDDIEEVEDEMEAAEATGAETEAAEPLLPGSSSSYYYRTHPFLLRLQFKLRRLIRRMGDYLAYATLLIMLILIPRVVYNCITKQKFVQAAIRSARVMVCGTIVLSIRLVYLHLTHWYMPQVQKYVVRILWMVPLYALQSWLSLVYPPGRIYIDTMRDLYEAYVIASFVYYLMELLGGEQALVQLLIQKRESHADLGHHAWPMSYLFKPWELGEEFMIQCKHGALQYVVVKIFTTGMTLMFQGLKIYGEGNFHPQYAYPYLCFLQNISVMHALYCLVMLYHATYEELSTPINWRPLGKFLCVKGVVFFTWWQGIVINYLESCGWIPPVGSRSAKDVASGLIDYCIVVEMIGFAIAHSFTFSYKEYLPENIPPPPAPLPPPQQQQQQPAVANTNNNGGEDSAEQQQDIQQPSSFYHPPATLDRPMRPTDAFWISTVPRETYQDIQRLPTVEMIRERQRELRRRLRSSWTNLQQLATASTDDNNNDEDEENQEEAFNNNDANNQSDEPALTGTSVDDQAAEEQADEEVEQSPSFD